jgi:hypothetical protein
MLNLFIRRSGLRMMARMIAKLKRNEHAKSAIVIAVVAIIVLGLFLGVSFGLHVSARVVESGSMSLPQNHLAGPAVPYTFADVAATFRHPFFPTLDTSDIIIIQAVNPKDLNSNYPNSDIIVYKNPDNPGNTPIVHRLVAVNDINGTLYFQTARAR